MLVQLSMSNYESAGSWQLALHIYVYCRLGFRGLPKPRLNPDAACWAHACMCKDPVHVCTHSHSMQAAPPSTKKIVMS